MQGSKSTLSRPRPPSTRSDVAATLPPFLCRSHMMSLRLSCGNICATCSTWAPVNLWPFLREFVAVSEDRDDIKYRIMKNERKATKASDGMDRVASSSEEAIVLSVDVPYRTSVLSLVCNLVSTGPEWVSSKSKYERQQSCSQFAK